MTHEMMAPPRAIRPPPGLADSSLNDASTPATHRSAPSPSSVDDGRWTTARAAARSLISSGGDVRGSLLRDVGWQRRHDLVRGVEG